MRENREIPSLARRADRPGGPLREGRGRKPEMNERGKSDSPVVPAKPPNKAGQRRRRWWREGGWPRGTRTSKTRPGHRAGPGAPSALDRVREVARRDKEARFTALLHHVDLDRLRAAYWAIRPKAAPGVDGVTWAAVRAGPGGQPPGPARAAAAGALPGEADHGGCTSRRRTGGNGRSASPRWRTRSSSGPSSRCSTPSTRWTSWASPTGSCVPNRKGA